MMTIIGVEERENISPSFRNPLIKLYIYRFLYIINQFFINTMNYSIKNNCKNKL